MRANIRLPLALTGVGVLAAALAGCGGLNGDVSTSTTTDTSTSTATPTTPPSLSSADYQAALTTVDNGLAPAFGQLADAHTPQEITDATKAISAALNDPIGALHILRPPSSVAQDNTDLITGLQKLSQDLDSVSSSADKDSVCLGSAAIALLSRSDSLGQLRDTISRLAAADPANPYHVGTFVPPVTQDSDRSAGTGTVVAGRTHGGEGWLTITNGGDKDATVGLVPDNGNTPVVSVYVDHGATYTLKGITDGTYQVFMTSGSDWDANARLFARDCDFQRFDDTLNYTTNSSSATTYEITVTPVINGNASASSVDPNSFPH